MTLRSIIIWRYTEVLFLILCLFIIQFVFMSEKDNFQLKEVASSNIYIIVTTSIIDPNDSLRKQQYIDGIQSLHSHIDRLPSAKVIIVENNGKRETYLDELGFDIFYTDNNSLPVEKGVKEIQDILDCIDTYNIRPDDFIVKMTGRYRLAEYSDFFQSVSRLNDEVHCIIKYANINERSKHVVDKSDCITGLIGMRAKYIQQIDDSLTPIEWAWAKKSSTIPEENVIILDTLGIHISVGQNNYSLW